MIEALIYLDTKGKAEETGKKSDAAIASVTISLGVGGETCGVTGGGGDGYFTTWSIDQNLYDYYILFFQ